MSGAQTVLPLPYNEKMSARPNACAERGAGGLGLPTAAQQPECDLQSDDTY